jgi:hypothetical protein
MPLRPIYIPDGFHRGSVTFRASWEYFDEPCEPPPPPDYIPSGPFSTPGVVGRPGGVLRVPGSPVSWVILRDRPAF